MLRSKSLLNLKFVFSVATSAALLSACTLPKSSPADPSKTSNATFYVASSEITVTTQKLDSNVSVPVSKTFSFKVCVKDNRLSQTIVNHKFEIQTEGDPIEKFTDAAGCLVWSEDIGYNHLAPAHYLELIRTIRAEGYQKGERSLRFAIDPWENQAESLMDKNREDLVPYKDLAMTLQGASSKDSAELAHPVWVDDLRLTVYEKQMSTQGMVLDFLIRTSPSIVMISNTGERILQPLTYGEFDTEISLIHVVSENQKQVRRLLTAPVKTKGTMAEGYLSIEAPITLSQICTRGQIEIGLKLIPKNAPKNLLPFEGVFVGGDCDQIKGSSFNRLTNAFQEAKGKLTIAQYLTDSTIPSASTSASTDASAATNANSDSSIKGNGDSANAEYYNPGQIIVQVPMQINGVGFLDQHTIERTRLFKVTACMSGPLDLKNMRNQTFTVTKVNGGTADVKTSPIGCVSWDDSYKFNFLENESWREVSVRIANKNLGMDQKLIIHINPWGPTDNTAFRDIRNFDSQGQTLYAAKGQSQIILNTYSYDKAKYDYAMDSSLGLSMKKVVTFRLNPRIKRPSLTDPSGYSEEALPIGAYALRWAVVDMSVDDLTKAQGKILQADEKLVIMNGNSTIAETLVLQTSELKEVASTNKLYVELYPLKENAQALLAQNPKLSLDDLSDTTMHLAHSTYWGPLTLANNNEGTTLVSYRDTQTSLFPALKKQYALDEASRLTRERQLARKEKFASDNTLAIINLNDANTTLTFRKNLTYGRYFVPRKNKFVVNGSTAPYSEDKIRQWLRTGKMDKDLMSKLCDVFTYELMYSANGKYKNVFTADGISNMNELCSLGLEDNSAFEIQYRYFVQNPQLISAQSPEVRDAQIGTGFSFNRGITNSLTTSLNVNLGAKVDIPYLEFLGASAGTTYSVSKSHSENNGYGSQQLFTTGVALTMEKVQATIHADGFEKCAMVKLGPAFFENTDQDNKAAVSPGIMQKIAHHLGFNSSLKDFVDPSTTDAALTRMMSRGILVCDGAPSKTPTTFQENYYVINQRMPYTTMVDPASDQSRPFFAALRGDQDFNRFMSYVEGSYTNPETGTAQDVNAEMISAKMRGLFSYTPTYPGQIVREH